MPEPTEPQPDERPLLILVSSFGRTSREYFLASIASRYRLWLFLGGPGRPVEPTWELPYLAGHTSLDTLDAAAMTAAANRLNAQLKSEHGETIAGIVSYDESRILATAAVAEALNLPTSPTGAVERCRDKYLTRQALAAANVPQATAIAVRTPEQATAAARNIGYPVVLKPRHLAASFGVTRADTAGELEAAYHRAHTRNKHQVRRVLIVATASGVLFRQGQYQH